MVVPETVLILSLLVRTTAIVDFFEKTPVSVVFIVVCYLDAECLLSFLMPRCCSLVWSRVLMAVSCISHHEWWQMFGRLRGHLCL